jgi:hypothetical protein
MHSFLALAVLSIKIARRIDSNCSHSAAMLDFAGALPRAHGSGDGPSINWKPEDLSLRRRTRLIQPLIPSAKPPFL